MDRFKYTILFSFLISFGFGQITTGFKKLSVQGYVSQSIIYTIAQDSLGNIWAGTEEGVMRYNSKDLFLYNKYQGMPDFASNRISDIFIDSENRIWVGVETGLLKYELEKNIFVPVIPDKNDNLNLVNCIIEGKKNNLWIGDFNGLWFFDIKTDSLKNVFKDKSVFSLEYTGNGLLVGTNKGLYYFDEKIQKAEKINIDINNDNFSVSCIKKIGNNYYIGTMENGLFLLDEDKKFIGTVDIPVFSDRYFRINSILKLNNDLVVIGTDGAGLIYLDRNNNYINSAINDVNDPNSISSNGIYDILLGKENILWIATYGGGINILPFNKLKFRNISHIINDKNSLIYNFTRAICEDTQRKIWFGTKQGLSIWDRGLNKWINKLAIQKSSKVPDIILALEEDGEYMWIATYGNGVFKVDKRDYSYTHYGNIKNTDKKIGLSKVYSLLKDSHNNIWLGGIDGDLHEIKKDGEIVRYPVPLVKDIIELQDGAIIAVGRMGVNIIRNGKIDTIVELSQGHNELHYTTINCVKQNSKGNLIIGTNGEGLIFYDMHNKLLKKINISNGMPSDIVQAILMQQDTDLWVSTTGGLAHIFLNKQDTAIYVYNKFDGVVSNEFNYGSAAKLSDGSFMFGGIDGVTMFDPKAIKLQRVVPNVVIEQFKLFKTKETKDTSLTLYVNNVNNLHLRYNENSFNIKFVGILHSAPSKVLYSWKMSRINDIWSEPSTETQINFINLSPGKYIFYVKASNRDGIWSPAKMLSIHISPPWWKTTLAYLFYIILFLLAVGALFYGINLYLTKRNAEEQINFFNSITHELKTPLTILLSTIETFPKIADNPALLKIKSTSRQLINLFEQLLNFHLVTSDEQKSDNIKELSLNTYIGKVISRFKPLLEEKSITVEVVNKWEKENQNDYFYYDKYILDKILFNLLSNAIKYSNKGGKIKIVLDKKKDDLIISITDNGIGIPKDQQKYILKRYYRGRNAINSNLPGTGLGLMIVKNIIEKDKGFIKFTSVENKGSTFTVSLKNKKQQFIEKNKLKNDEVQLPVAEREALDEYSDSKILIVEDNNELRADLVDKLGTYFQVYEAENGKEGLKIAMDIFPDLIITDLIMPEMDGLEMSRALQDDINLNHIPIIMMTVLTGNKQKMESVESGISIYLEKPVDYNYLLAKVINSLGWSKKLREKYLHEFDVGSAAKFRTQKDADFINKLENYVLSNINEEDLSVHNLCSFVNMSRTALYMKLKNMVDLSPQNFIIHTRLKYARKKLIEGKMNVKEVAYSSGFSNPKYFSTSFKKLFGISPTTFLKNLKNNNTEQ